MTTEQRRAVVKCHRTYERMIEMQRRAEEWAEVFTELFEDLNEEQRLAFDDRIKPR